MLALIAAKRADGFFNEDVIHAESPARKVEDSLVL